MKPNVHFMIDEAATLGRMDPIDSAISVGRGYSLRLNFIYQSIGQLRRCYPDGQDVTFLSNVAQIFFAVNDNTTADFVSTRLGEQTVIVNSGGNSHGGSTQNSPGPQGNTSHGANWNASDSWALQARRLLKPEEIMTLSPRLAITFVPGACPILTELIRYYEEKRLGQPRRWSSAEILNLVSSAVQCLLAFLLAMLFTAQWALLQQQHSQPAANNPWSLTRSR